MAVLSDGPQLTTFGVSRLCSARTRRCINLRSRNHRTLVTPERGNAGPTASAARGVGRATALRGLRVILDWLFVPMVGLWITPPVLPFHAECALGAWRGRAPQCAGRGGRSGGRVASLRELRSSSGALRRGARSRLRRAANHGLCTSERSSLVSLRTSTLRCAASRASAPGPGGEATGKKAPPVNNSRAASAHFAMNDAWSWMTAGQVKRAFVSRHSPGRRPPPSHLSSRPKPPV